MLAICNPVIQYTTGKAGISREIKYMILYNLCPNLNRNLFIMAIIHLNNQDYIISGVISRLVQLCIEYSIKFYKNKEFRNHLNTIKYKFIFFMLIIYYFLQTATSSSAWNLTQKVCSDSRIHENFNPPPLPPRNT